MQPNVTIIIPVYNVEAYLRQCLDSVVNQTLRDVQIVCVNDGSSDASLAILEEYADRDSRVTIINKPNGGVSSARNAAYPSIKGKYTLFVDPDDWIDLDTCEKCFEQAEQTEAEIVVFFFRREYLLGSKVSMNRVISPGKKITPGEKRQILTHHPFVCGKLWRSDFLLDKNLVFPEGLTSEDYAVTWRAIPQADQIFVLPEPLYHYRNNPDSITQTSIQRFADTVAVHALTLSYLLESGHYSTYKDIFIPQKLRGLEEYYDRIPSSRPNTLRLIHESLTEDDRRFYRSAAGNVMSTDTILFYQGIIDGGRVATMKYYFFKAAKSIERFIKQGIVKPMRRIILANRQDVAQKTDSNADIVSFPSQESGKPTKRHVA